MDNCFGSEEFNDGTNYVGEWKDDKFHSRGILTYLGNIQDGYWVKGACKKNLRLENFMTVD